MILHVVGGRPAACTGATSRSICHLIGKDLWLSNIDEAPLPAYQLILISSIPFLAVSACWTRCPLSLLVCSAVMVSRVWAIWIWCLIYCLIDGHGHIWPHNHLLWKWLLLFLLSLVLDLELWILELLVGDRRNAAPSIVDFIRRVLRSARGWSQVSQVIIQTDCLVIHSEVLSFCYKWKPFAQ